MRFWITITLLLALAASTVIVAVDVAVDIYGLYRDPTQRRLPVYGDERIAKFLLGTRYIHASFDGVLVGSSVTANWPVAAMHSAHLYNDSVNGGNIVEEARIFEHLLGAGEPRGVLLVVHPFVTASHDFSTVELGPRQERGALGSLNLLDAYKTLIKVRLGGEKLEFDENGTALWEDRPRPLNATLEEMMRPGTDFAIDPIARGVYHELVAELHRRKIPLAFVIPPTADAIRARKPQAFAKYNETILADRAPEDRVLDFTDDDLAHNAANFVDGVHMTAAAAAKLVAEMDAQLAGWRRDANRHQGVAR